jgi:hypothetical protein
VKYIKLFEDIHIHDRWEQQSIEREDIKEFAETLFVNLLDDGFTVDTDVIYSESSQDPKKYVRVFIRNEESRRTPFSDSFNGNIKYSTISDEIQTFVEYIKRKWKIVDVTYEYEELIVPENIDAAYIKTRKKSKELSADTKLLNGKFNLTITQLDKEPNMFQKFIKRF